MDDVYRRAEANIERLTTLFTGLNAIVGQVNNNLSKTSEQLAAIKNSSLNRELAELDKTIAQTLAHIRNPGANGAAYLVIYHGLIDRKNEILGSLR